VNVNGGGPYIIQYQEQVERRRRMHACMYYSIYVGMCEKNVDWMDGYENNTHTHKKCRMHVVHACSGVDRKNDTYITCVLYGNNNNDEN
jgi:hypothetical protein